MTQVWLGVPLEEYVPTPAEESDPFFSKIGGFPIWLRPRTGGVDCLECGTSTAVRLVSQIHAPLGVYDRILYVFTCDSCSKDGCCGMFAMRSSVYNPSYEQRQRIPCESDGKEPAGALFEVDDDWGDGEDALPAAAAPPAAVAAASSSCEQPLAPAAAKVVFPLAPTGKNVGKLAAAPYPVLALDTIPEPPKEKVDHGSLEDQLRAVDELHGPGAGVIDMTSIEEEDEETDDERLLRKFVKRIDRVPSQCLRWCPDSPPLLCRSERLPKIPVCGCGSPRRFEFQLVPPAIYFLTRSLGEKNHKLHFGNVLVFTCSADCCTDSAAYTNEFVVVQPEI